MPITYIISVVRLFRLRISSIKFSYRSRYIITNIIFLLKYNIWTGFIFSFTPPVHLLLLLNVFNLKQIVNIGPKSTHHKISPNLCKSCKQGTTATITQEII